MPSQHPAYCYHEESGDPELDVICMAQDPASGAPLRPCHLRDGHQTDNHHARADAGPCHTWTTRGRPLIEVLDG